MSILQAVLIALFSYLAAECVPCLLYTSTATYDGKGHYNHDEHGDCISYTFSDYGREGKRSGFWYVDNVENYHRRMGTIITTLAHTGFFVEDMVETLPDEHALHECPGMIKEFIKPSFLIVRARKMTREM